MSQKIKSQCGRQIEVILKHRAKWPHEYVLAGNNKERVTYDQFTMGQWMAGFCKVPKKSLYRNTATELSQGKTRGVCNDINSVNPYPTHQHYDNSQKMPNNVTTAHSKQVVPQDLVTVQHIPVKCGISDLNASVQSQCTTVENFNMEEVVTLYIWANRNSSKDYTACIQQNGDQFGYIPLYDLKLYYGPEVTWENIPSILQAHKLIRQSGVPNFLNCRTPVQTKLNPARWRYYLTDYWDKQLPDLIQYGFPLDFDRKCPLSSSDTNHASALNYETHVDEYIQEELEHGALYGPFQDVDFNIHVSPLMTREKAKFY